MMADPQSEKVRGLLDGMCTDERDHHHYSLALGWLLGLLLLAVVAVGLVAASAQPLAHPACRSVQSGLPPAIQPLALELVRDPQALRDLLRGQPRLAYAAPAEVTEAMCIQDRAARHRAVLSLDSALFIPLYVLVTLVALGWVLAVSVHLREPNGRHRPLPRWLPWLLLASLSVVGVTAGLDVVENSAAWRLLDLSVVLGARVEQVAVDHARAASMHKWLVAGAWAASLALLSWLQRAALALPAWPGQNDRWPRRLVWLLIATGVCAALTLLAGAGLGLAGAPPAMELWLRRLLTLGFATVLAQAALMFALHWLRRRPHQLLPAPGDDGDPVVMMPAPPP